MFKWLAQKWAVNDPLPLREVNLIAVISYAGDVRELTNGSREVTRLGVELSCKYPSALIGWGSFSKNPSSHEKEIKRRVFPTDRSLYVGKVSSTTDECEAIRKVVADKGVFAKRIVVVAEGAHSRRAKRVWEYYFPNSEICFRSVPAENAGDERNPMFLQRNWRIWLLVNILLYPLYLGDGVKRMSRLNFSQPA